MTEAAELIQAVPSLERIARVAKDMLKATQTLGRTEARFLVDMYYAEQDRRKAAFNQIGAIERGAEESGEGIEPHEALAYIAAQNQQVEKNIARMLEAYTLSHPLGQWPMSQVGIGPVITAGLLAHIDIEKAPTVGHIWRLAGLDPTHRWLGRAGAAEVLAEHFAGRSKFDEAGLREVAAVTRRRPDSLLRLLVDRDSGEIRETVGRAVVESQLAKLPWNAGLKVLCWKIGESFVKVSGQPGAYYGQAYKARKALEEAKNAAGDYAGQAAHILDTRRIGATTEAYKAYSAGRLPAAHIHARAKRYAVKLFLAHLHADWYERTFDAAPPLPYPIAHLGHAHHLPKPN